MNTEEGISMVMTQTLLKQIFVAIACMGLSLYFISNPVTATVWGFTVNISTICIIVYSILRKQRYKKITAKNYQ